MRIGIDFGTSYSAAGAVVDGELRLVRFGDDSQFRTTVFFPQRQPDMAAFELTPALEREVERLVAAGRRERAAQSARLQRTRDEAMRAPPDRRQAALDMLPRATPRSDEDLHRDALAAVRRAWADEQRRLAGEETLDTANALYGEEGVDAYIASGSGQLVVSPKSMLGYRLHGRARESLLAITTHILRHIRETAGRQYGAEVDAAVLGRPVEFRSSMGDAGGAQALAILREAAAAAGFGRVEFLHEPAAAALGHHRDQPRVRRTLVVDVGGGTTDVALADAGGGMPAPRILQAWGLPQGGTDVDIDLSMREFMPLLGKDVTRTPVHRYYEAAAVHDVERQRNFRRMTVEDVPEPFGSRLACLQQGGNTIRLNRGVEGAKISLSREALAQVALDYLEPGLSLALARAALDEAAARFVATLQALLRTVEAALERPPEVLYLTGGMSRAPYVVDAAAALFPGAEVVAGNASLGVVGGLALAAAAAGPEGGLEAS